MAVVEACVTKAIVDVESVCARRVACERLGLDSSKALSKAAVQGMGGCS
jgi:hypothetical protein